MPTLITLGATAALVTVSYLVPLIITCVISGIVIVVTFVVTRACYKKEHKKDDEVQNLRKQQAQRDNAIHEEVSRIALETGIDIQELLKLSKEQQKELKIAIQEFMQSIDDSDTATKNLTTIANTIQEATNNANMQTTDICKELELMKKELANVYRKLSSTEQALALKEAELKKTINKLAEFGEKITTNVVLDKLNELENIRKEYTEIYPSVKELAIKDEEIMSLKSKNITLSSTITSLNKIIENLQKKLSNHSEVEKLQIQEIKKLISDNKLLTKTIESLAEKMEVQNKKITKDTQNTTSQLRMFK